MAKQALQGVCCTNFSGLEKSRTAYGKLSDLLVTVTHTGDCSLSELMATVPYTADHKLSELMLTGPHTADHKLSELPVTKMGADCTGQVSMVGMQHWGDVQDPEAERGWADCQEVYTGSQIAVESE